MTRGFNISSWIDAKTATRFIKDIILMGATHVRYNLSVVSDVVLQDEEEYQRWLVECIDKIRTITESLEADGFYIKFIIDLHSPFGGIAYTLRRPAHTILMSRYHRRRWYAHLRLIVKALKHNPYVWAFEPINEPIITTRRKYERVMGGAVRRLRSITRKRILYPCPGVGPREMRLVEPVAARNIIYTCHMYSPYEFTHAGIGAPIPTNPLEYINKFKVKQFLRPVVRFMQEHKKPVIIGEIGCSTYVGAVAQREYFKLVLEECERQNLGWLVYPYDPTANIWNYQGSDALGTIRSYLP